MRPGIVYFLCRDCGHNVSAYRALANAKLWDGGQVSEHDALPFASRMKCTKCKAKSVSVCMPADERPTQKVVATDRGISRVYHDPDCHFARKINLEDLIEFECEDLAIRQAYVACGHCFKAHHHRR